MDMNYLMAREQISLMRAEAANDVAVRQVHENFAKGYAAQIIELRAAMRMPKVA